MELRDITGTEASFQGHWHWSQSSSLSLESLIHASYPRTPTAVSPPLSSRALAMHFALPPTLFLGPGPLLQVTRDHLFSRAPPLHLCCSLGHTSGSFLFSVLSLARSLPSLPLHVPQGFIPLLNSLHIISMTTCT
jgi:hypothetical protein